VIHASDVPVCHVPATHPPPTRERSLKTILVPLDGSALAEQVLPSVHMLAPILGAKVKLLHVVLETDRYHLAVDFDPVDPIAPRQEQRLKAWDVLRQNAEKYLDRPSAQLRAAGIESTFEVRLGAPAEIIVEAAEREQVELIAMATHGYSGLRRWALGSVTDKVIHATDVPVCVVRGTQPPPSGERSLTRILVPLDGSALARQALPFAARLAGRTRAELILLTVAPPPILEAPELMSSSPRYDDMLVGLKDEVMVELGGLADELHQRDVQVTPMAVNGFPADMIIDVAARQQADLIVMATHGYSGLKRWALGSVADKVLHAAPIPLMLVHARAQG
jgi:nucleotide-binding universal stress UspA family protein